MKGPHHSSPSLSACGMRSASSPPATARAVYRSARSTWRPRGRRTKAIFDEIKIGKNLRRDSLRPYLTKESRYRRHEQNHINIMRPLDGEMQRPIREEGWAIVKAPAMTHAPPVSVPGRSRWCGRRNGPRSFGRHNSYSWRNAVRTLQDVGLLDVTPGPRGPFGTRRRPLDAACVSAAGDCERGRLRRRRTRAVVPSGRPSVGLP
jgi:hypothetical protein